MQKKKKRKKKTPDQIQYKYVVFAAPPMLSVTFLSPVLMKENASPVFLRHWSHLIPTYVQPVINI